MNLDNLFWLTWMDEASDDRFFTEALRRLSQLPAEAIGEGYLAFTRWDKAAKTTLMNDDELEAFKIISYLAALDARG